MVRTNGSALYGLARKTVAIPHIIQALPSDRSIPEYSFNYRLTLK